MLFHMLKTTFFAHACQQCLGHNASEFSAALRFINTACACLWGDGRICMVYNLAQYGP